MPGRLILEVEPRSVSAHPIFNPPGRAIFSLAVLYFPYCERRSHYGKYRTGGAFDTPTQSATTVIQVQLKYCMSRGGSDCTWTVVYHLVFPSECSPLWSERRRREGEPVQHGTAPPLSSSSSPHTHPPVMADS